MNEPEYRLPKHRPRPSTRGEAPLERDQARRAAGGCTGEAGDDRGSRRCRGPVLVETEASSFMHIANTIPPEATLPFLGFGVPPGTPTWGNMLNAARTSFTTHPLLAIAPGPPLTLAVLAINFVGDGLRDAFDPRGGR